MSKHVFKRKFEDIDYEVEAESLPSGSVCFTFKPPLPGRAAVVCVPQEVVEALVQDAAVGSDYDHETDSIVLSLHLVTKVVPTRGHSGYKTAVEMVPARVFLDMTLDHVMTRCDDCHDLHYGDDVLAPDEEDAEDEEAEGPTVVEATPEKPKKTWLN
jgi:hypothetical protein